MASHEPEAAQEQELKQEERSPPDANVEQQQQQQQQPQQQRQSEQPSPPSMSISQIVPLVVSLALSKYDLQEMGYTRYVEVSYVMVQIVCLAVLGCMYMRIDAMPDGGEKLKIPEVKQMGQVVSPATEQSPKEYDLTKLLAQLKQVGIGALVLGGVYYKWGYLFPLVLQVFTTPLQLMESPLFRIHILRAEVARPFPDPNPFAFQMPEPPQDETKAAIEKESQSDVAKSEQEKKDE